MFGKSFVYAGLALHDLVVAVVEQPLHLRRHLYDGGGGGWSRW